MTTEFKQKVKDPVFKSKRRQGLKKIDRNYSAASKALKAKQK